MSAPVATSLRSGCLESARIDLAPDPCSLPIGFGCLRNGGVKADTDSPPVDIYADSLSAAHETTRRFLLESKAAWTGSIQGDQFMPFARIDLAEGKPPEYR